MKRWTSSLKQQLSPTDITNTKEKICLEQIKRKVKIADLEWDDFVFLEQLNSLMYVDYSLCGDSKKDKLIDELNFKNWVRLKRKTTSKFFVVITEKVYFSS